MNKIVKEALAKGKVLRAELDRKAEKEKLALEEEIKVVAVKLEKQLQEEAERYLAYIPDCLVEAVSKREASFTLMTNISDNRERHNRLCALIEPKLKKMGLEFKRTSSTGWIQLSYDPDTGYDATYYHLEVIVPEND